MSKTYKSVEEFFEEPTDPEIEAYVDAQIAIIDYSVAFGRYLCMNYEPLSQDLWDDGNFNT